MKKKSHWSIKTNYSHCIMDKETLKSLLPLLPSLLLVTGSDPIFPKSSIGGRRALNVRYLCIDKVQEDDGRIKFDIATSFSHTDREWEDGRYVDVQHDDENLVYSFDLPIDEFRLLCLVLMGRITPYQGYRALHLKHHTNLDFVEDENGERIEGWKEKYYATSRSERGEMWYKFDERYCRSKTSEKKISGPGIGMLLHWIDHEERTTPCLNLVDVDQHKSFSEFVGTKIELLDMPKVPKAVPEASEQRVLIRVPFENDVYETVSISECLPHEREIADILLACNFAREIYVGTFNLGGFTIIKKIGETFAYTEQDLEFWAKKLETFIKATDLADQNYGIDLLSDRGCNIQVRRLHGTTWFMDPEEFKKLSA